MMKVFIIEVIISFLSTYFLTSFFTKYFKQVGIVSTDVHKKSKPLVPSSGGVPVCLGIVISLLFFIFTQVFFLNKKEEIVYVFSSLTSILLVMFAGFLDDINTRQVKVGKYIEGKEGLKRWQRPLLTVPAAIPLMAIMAGYTTMSIPFIGSVNFGIYYPLIIVPIGVIGASNMINMLGGYNGLEGTLGLIYTTSLGIFSFIHGRYIVSAILLATSASLLAFLRYNWYPAKILPGDSLTYLLGAVVAVSAIIGNMEKAAVITMSPFLFQGVLKFYSRIKLGRFASDLGILRKDGTIKSKYKKIYSLTHIALRFVNTEKKVVIFLSCIQLFFSILPFLISF